MDEIDAVGRQMLIDRPLLTKGRLSVYRESKSSDHWFPRLSVSLKRTGTDIVLWEWTSHTDPIDYEEPPPYGEDVILEKYFELETPLKSPRGLECVFRMGPGESRNGHVEKFSAQIYLYEKSLEERGQQVGVVDFASGLTCKSVPLFIRVNFPW